jgi:hypothetical protein
MRIILVIPLLLLAAVPAVAEGSSAETNPAADRNQARWAEWEAQARITDGDYDGAVQAERQADSDRDAADRQEAIDRSSKR